MMYYETHITVEPVFDEKLEQFKAIAKSHGFRVAELLLQKHRQITPERSDKDSFCTGRHGDYKVAFDAMTELMHELRYQGFTVWRAKIEHVLFDIRYGSDECQRNQASQAPVVLVPATGDLLATKL